MCPYHGDLLANTREFQIFRRESGMARSASFSSLSRWRRRCRFWPSRAHRRRCRKAIRPRRGPIRSSPIRRLSNIPRRRMRPCRILTISTTRILAPPRCRLRDRASSPGRRVDQPLNMQPSYGSQQQQAYPSNQPYPYPPNQQPAARRRYGNNQPGGVIAPENNAAAPGGMRPPGDVGAVGSAPPQPRSAGSGRPGSADAAVGVAAGRSARKPAR